MVGHVERLCGGASALGGFVLAERRQTVCLRGGEREGRVSKQSFLGQLNLRPVCAMSHLGALDEFLGGGLLVVELSSPGSKGRGLQGAAVGEGQGPGLGQRAGVDGVQVDAGLLFGLATRQEGHS